MAQSIVIQFLSGPNMGQRQRFSESPVTFGRDAKHPLVLAEPFVSRKHGALVLDESGRWGLVNLSSNGTRVNAKLITAQGGKPRRLRSGDTVIVGNQPVFTVALEGAAAGDAGEPEADDDAKSSLSGRSKVWIGIGVYMLLMLGLFVFLSTLGGGGGDGAGTRPDELTSTQIKAAIESPLEPERPPNPGAADRHLLEARQWYARRDIERSANFRAHTAYKRSLAADNRIAFEEGLDQQRFLEVQDALVTQIDDLYHQGYNQLVSGNFEGAVKSFDQLIMLYADKDSVIYQNAVALRNHAAAKLRRR